MSDILISFPRASPCGSSCVGENWLAAGCLPPIGVHYGRRDAHRSGRTHRWRGLAQRRPLSPGQE